MDANTPLFLQLTEIEKKASIEALIFSAEEPLSLKALFKLLISNEVPFDEPKLFSDSGEEINQISISDEIQNKFEFTLNDIKILIEEINKELIETNRPYQIVEFAGGYSFATRTEFGMLIQQLTKTKLKKRLSQAAMETLAIIAYRQPVTKAEVEQIRGVSSIDNINNLIEKHFVEILGRKEALGKPLIYGTTKEFLRIFGLRDLEDLPKLRELEEFNANVLPESEDIEIIVDTPELIDDEIKEFQEKFIPLQEGEIVVNFPETEDEFKEIHEELNKDFKFDSTENQLD